MKKKTLAGTIATTTGLAGIITLGNILPTKVEPVAWTKKSLVGNEKQDAVIWARPWGIGNYRLAAIDANEIQQNNKGKYRTNGKINYLELIPNFNFEDVSTFSVEMRNHLGTPQYDEVIIDYQRDKVIFGLNNTNNKPGFLEACEEALERIIK